MNINYLLSSVSKNRTIIFDLDNTIYEERLFLFKAYKNICKKFYKNKWEDSYKFLVEEFEYSQHKNIFSKLLAEFPSDDLNLEKIIKFLRLQSFKNELEPFDWFKQFLSKIPKEYKIRIITNGNPSQQKNKFKSINFSNSPNEFELICANETKPKPHKQSFYELKNFSNFISPVYVGDSISDEEFCANLKIEFFNVSLLI